MKTNWLNRGGLWLCLSFLSAPFFTESPGQSADRLVLEGRAFLAQSNLASAHLRFSSAVSASPKHPTANFFYAATRILTVVNQPASEDMMDRLGVDLDGRSIYNWTAGMLTDFNGVPYPPNNYDAMEAVDFLRSTLLPEMRAAVSNLTTITDPFFIVSLTAKETTLAPVTLDYGDVQMLKALLFTAEFLGYSFSAYNFHAQLNELYYLYWQEQFTIQCLLADFPEALTYANTNDFVAAKDAFQSAVDAYLAASIFIRQRPPNVVHLFNLDLEQAKEEADFRKTLQELKLSLNGPIAISTVTNRPVTVHMAKMFDGSLPLRFFLPQFSTNALVLGTIPDSSFGGLVRGVSPSEIDDFLTSRWNADTISNFKPARPLPNGGVQFELASKSEAIYVIEASEDLLAWTRIATVIPTNSMLVIEDQGSSQGRLRFYRAWEVSDFIAFAGKVVNTMDQPIPGASVTIWRQFGTPLKETVTTDSNGRFHVITDLRESPIGFFSVSVEAEGYPTSDFWRYSSKNQITDFRLVLGQAMK